MTLLTRLCEGCKQNLIPSNLFLPTFQYFHQGTLTQLSNRLHYWDLNCLRLVLETESTIGFEAPVGKDFAIRKTFICIVDNSFSGGGNERLMGIKDGYQL